MYAYSEKGLIIDQETCDGHWTEKKSVTVRQWLCHVRQIAGLVVKAAQERMMQWWMEIFGLQITLQNLLIGEIGNQQSWISISNGIIAVRLIVRVFIIVDKCIYLCF